MCYEFNGSIDFANNHSIIVSRYYTINMCVIYFIDTPRWIVKWAVQFWSYLSNNQNIFLHQLSTGDGSWKKGFWPRIQKMFYQLARPSVINAAIWKDLDGTKCAYQTNPCFCIPRKRFLWESKTISFYQKGPAGNARRKVFRELYHFQGNVF